MASMTNIDWSTRCCGKGCGPPVIAIIAILGLLAAGFGIKQFLLGNSDSSKTSASSGSSVDNPSAPLDGHWILVDGLNNPGYDMGVACDANCQSGRQMTVDKSDITIDISGDKVTGGTFKTGYSSTTGKNCTQFDSKVDATVTGGADQANKCGQLIIDGTQTNTSSCDSNLQPLTNKSKLHSSRFYYLSAPDTLTACYNLNATFNGCTTVGFSTPPPNGGVAATFKRG